MLFELEAYIAVLEGTTSMQPIMSSKQAVLPQLLLFMLPCCLQLSGLSGIGDRGNKKMEELTTSACLH